MKIEYWLNALLVVVGFALMAAVIIATRTWWWLFYVPFAIVGIINTFKFYKNKGE